MKKPAVQFKMTKDYARLKHLHKKAFPDDYLRTFKKDVCWLIYLRGEVAGFCSLRKCDGDSVFLSRAAIFKNKKGLHRKAIRHRLQWAKRQGLTWAVTYASIDNFKSIVNLLRCGFELYQPDYDYAGEGFLYFRKRLQFD